jgi:thioredoxin-like negative regulator of GroEL
MKEADHSLSGKEYILFTTSTCHKCPAFKEELEATGLTGIIMNDDADDFLAMAQSFGVRSVPTVVLLQDNETMLVTDDIYELNNLL